MIFVIMEETFTDYTENFITIRDLYSDLYSGETSENEGWSVQMPYDPEKCIPSGRFLPPLRNQETLI